MEALCLDTDILVNVIRGKLSLAPFANHATSTTIITLLELYYGAYKRNPQDVALIDFLSRTIEVISLKEDDVKLAGKIMASLEATGKKLDFRDIMIGAICINRKLTILTKNLKHFERMREFGLSITSP
jgi:tRNA(fMet)-specific endonuclease VapC